MPRLPGSDSPGRAAAGRNAPRRVSRVFGRYRHVCASVVLGALLAACQPSLSPEDGPTLVRFFNAASDAQGPLRFSLSGGFSSTLARGDESGYAEIVGGVYAVTVEDEASRWSAGGNMLINRGVVQTVYAFGSADAEAVVLVGDEPRLPGENQALVRILHLAGAITGAVDVHILQVGQAVNPAAPAAVGLTFPSEHQYVFVDAVPRRIVVTVPGTATVIVDSGPLDFSPRAAYTAVLLNDSAGAAELIRLRDGV